MRTVELSRGPSHRAAPLRSVGSSHLAEVRPYFGTMRGSGRANPVVGRDEELGRFAQAVERASDREPSVLLVTGDPGIGKSTVVTEAARRSGVDAFVGRCAHVGGDAIPLAPVVDLFRQIQRRCDARSLPSLGPLVELATSGTGTSGDVFSLLLDLIGELGADAPVIVGWDDLHWGDQATWDIFDHLGRNMVDERIVLVGTYRNDEVVRDPALRRRVAELSRLSGVDRIVLQGLDRPAIAAHATAVLGSPAAPALVDELLRRGDGNPFFTEELAAAHLAGETIPPLLSDLIEADIAALAAPSRHVMAALAAIGRDTAPEMLSRVVDLDEPTTESAVRTAVEARLLVVDPSTDAYRVRHPMIGEVAYADALPTERRRLHRAVASLLDAEPRFALTASDAAGELAFHLDRAGDEAGAFAALLDAADSAELVAPSTALDHLERLLELWDRHADPDAEPELMRRLWQAADLANATGRNERSVELATRAIACGAPPDGNPWAYERLGRFLWSLGRMEESAETYARAAALLEGDSDAGAASAYAGLAQASLMFRQLDRAEHWSRRVLDNTGPAEPDTRAMALRVLGVIEILSGDFDRGLGHCADAVNQAVAVHRRSLAVAYQVIGLLIAGRPAEVVDIALDGAAEAQRAGFEGTFGTALSGLAAHALIRLGRWDEAEVVLAATRGVESMMVGAIGLDGAGAVLAARRGEDGVADALLDRLTAHPADPWHSEDVASAIAAVRLAQRRWDEAASVAAGALAPAPGVSSRMVPAFTSAYVIATVERTLDLLARKQLVDTEEIVEDLRRRLAVARVDPTAMAPTAKADLDLAAAMLTRLTGADPDAFASAAAAAEDSGDRWLAATAQAHEADAATSTAEAARAVERLRTAHETAVDLRAQPLVQEVEAIARRTRISLEAPVVHELEEHDAVRLGLTSREAEVLALVAAGKTNREIGSELYVSDKTASVHVSNILRKLGVSSRIEAAAVAQRVGIG